MSVKSDAPWTEWNPDLDNPWDLQRVVHLHRRVAFGASWGDVQDDLAGTPDEAVERVLSGKSRRGGRVDDFETMADTIGTAAVASDDPERLKAWWVYRMLFTPDPVAERLALMWHNHFATSNLKVDSLASMREQNELFRTLGRAPFGELLRRTVKQPALLVWLDAEANRKQHPNENLARELMELFTLGEGNYTERDVKEAARALSGWTVSRGRFRDVPEYHDGGSKTILGKTGNFNGDDLIDILLAHPATARRLAWRICDTLFGENAIGELALEQLADHLRENDLNIGIALRTILHSQVFFDRANLACRVSGPVEYVVGAVRALELFDPPPSTLLLVEQTARLGQDLFYPPNVFGWNGGRTWINTRTLLGRGNFAALLVGGRLHRSITPLDVMGLAQRHGIPQQRSAMLNFLSAVLTGREPNREFRKNVSKVCQDSQAGDAENARKMVMAVLAQPSAQLC